MFRHSCENTLTVFCCFLSKQTLYSGETFPFDFYCIILYNFANKSAFCRRKPIYDPNLKSKFKGKWPPFGLRVSQFYLYKTGHHDDNTNSCKQEAVKGSSCINLIQILHLIQAKCLREKEHKVSKLKCETTNYCTST